MKKTVRESNFDLTEEQILPLERFDAIAHPNRYRTFIVFASSCSV